jgi:FixJ family two-component response regulator
MSEDQPVVFIIDDDASVRNGLDALLRSVSLKVQTFGSADEFLRRARPDAPGCIVLDVRLPGPSGLDLQRELSKTGDHPPIIFISGHADVPVSVRAMKEGAIEFLTKPFSDHDLLEAIQLGIVRDRTRRQRARIMAELLARFATLTPREREVMALIAAGRSNKQVGGTLDVAEITVKVHRAQVMRKMEAHTLVDLARMADQLGITR